MAWSANNTTPTPNLTTQGMLDRRSTVENVLWSVILLIIILLSLAGNMAVIACVRLHSRLRREKGNLLVINLSLTDISSAVLVMVSSLQCLISDSWRLGPIWCDIVCGVNYTLITVSMLTLCFISLDRYMAIIHALDYHVKMTKKRIYILIAYAWLQGVAFGLVPIFTSQIRYDYWEIVCAIEWRKDNYLTLTYVIAVFSLCYSFPGVVLVIAYTKVTQVAKKHNSVHPVTVECSRCSSSEIRLPISSRCRCRQNNCDSQCQPSASTAINHRDASHQLCSDKYKGRTNTRLPKPSTSGTLSFQGDFAKSRSADCQQTNCHLNISKALVNNAHRGCRRFLLVKPLHLPGGITEWKRTEQVDRTKPCDQLCSTSGKPQGVSKEDPKIFITNSALSSPFHSDTATAGNIGSSLPKESELPLLCIPSLTTGSEQNVGLETEKGNAIENNENGCKDLNATSLQNRNRVDIFNELEHDHGMSNTETLNCNFVESLDALGGEPERVRSERASRGGQQNNRRNGRVPRGHNSAGSKAVMSLLILMLAYFVCMTPFSITKLYKVIVLEENSLPGYINLMASMFQYCSSAVNPLIYGIFRKDFRETVTMLVKKCLVKFRIRDSHSLDHSMGSN